MLRRPISYELSEKGVGWRQTRQRRRSQRICYLIARGPHATLRRQSTPELAMGSDTEQGSV